MRGPRLHALIFAAQFLFFASHDLPAQPANASTATPRSPNFILILCDDLGYGDIGPFGGTLIKTPALDRMGAEGLKLTAYHAAGSVCTPSRAGLLTGRYAVRMGLSYRTLEVNDERGLPDSEWTLAEALKTRGYATACIGKWHLGDRPPFHPTRHGFDEFYGVPYSNDMKPFALHDGERKIEEPADQAALTARYTRRALEFIADHRDAPFFLHLAHTMPHVPVHPSDAFRGKSAAGDYGDVVEELDASTGSILEALREQGLDENTMVIFTSDNGPWFEGSGGGLRGRKGESWSGGFVVPFIARWPGRIPAGQTFRAPVSGLDLMPTLLDIAGVTTPAGVRMDGRSIAAILSNPAQTPEWIAGRPLFLFDNDTLAAVRQDHWLFTVMSRYREGSVRLDQNQHYKPGLLFDLNRDPEAAYSLTRREPEIARRMSDVISKANADFGLGPKAQPLTRQIADKLSVKRIAAAAMVGLAAAFIFGICLGRRLRRS